MAPFPPQRLGAAVIFILMPLASCFTPTRRDVIQTITSVGTAVAIPTVANADYGKSSNIVMPSYIEYLIEKNQGTDTSDALYKGPDVEIQLKRIGEASNRLPEIATLADEKKWSQIQGIIAGPLGTLLQSMNNIATTKKTKDAAKVVKADLFEIGAAAGRKDSASCVKASEKAANDLEKFVKVAFE